MDSSREYKYSVIKLIEAVKVRPLLWDSSRAEFRSHKNKDKVWQDVFEELDDNYRFLSEKERSVIALKITTKWRNIRDVFIRSVKKRATDTKMKKYMYHDRLSFMLKLYQSYIGPESAAGSEQFDKSYNTHIKSLYENKAQRSISFDNAPENSLDENPKTSTSVEEELFSLKTEPDDDNNDVEELTTDGLDACSSSRNIVRVSDFDDDLERTSCSENQAVESENGSFHHQNHKEEKPIQRGLNQSSSGRNLDNVVILQSNEDEAFFTSILSSLRDMSLDEKIEFRIGVLQKISDIRSKRHNS